MGLALWSYFIAGALTGQVVVIVPLVSWLSFGAGSIPGLETAVARAVSETLRVCLDLDHTTTTTTSSAFDLGPLFQPWWFWVCLAGVVGLFLGLCCIGIPGIIWWTRLGADRDTRVAETSP